MLITKNPDWDKIIEFSPKNRYFDAHDRIFNLTVYEAKLMTDYYMQIALFDDELSTLKHDLQQKKVFTLEEVKETKRLHDCIRELITNAVSKMMYWSYHNTRGY